MRRAARVDVNHREIIDGLRAVGRAVIDLKSVGDGIPDAIVSTPCSMKLIEIKAPGKRTKLTPAQKLFHELWKGVPIEVVCSLEEAIEVTK